MKKIILSTFATLFVVACFAQSEKYMNTMKEKVAAVDTTWDATNLKSLSAAFERIADVEKTQWHPYYYAALTQVNAAFVSAMGGQPSAAVIDPLADKAEQLLAKAEALTKDNSEIFVVKKMIATARLMADPMNRYMQYGPVAQQALETAKKLNPDNPRVYLLEGQDKLYTPEQFGGSKTEAKKLFEEALKKYESYKPASAIDPSWGKSSIQYLMTQTN
ncbi:MAG TPA: hypothetical protein VEB42_13995 [Chitinophagaceae bacterium]|nr:hypothetical protein [Chitinophagaceae bacterium]